MAISFFQPLRIFIIMELRYICISKLPVMNMKLSNIAKLLLISAAFLSGCQNAGMKNNKTQTDILIANMDTSVSPAKDFFRYANGTWIKHNPIPASESQWGVGNLVQEETYTRLREINKIAAGNKSAKSNSAMQKIGDFYYTGMDTVGIEKNGI